MKNKIITILIVFLIMISNLTNAQHLANEDIWMGWSNNQYGQMSYGAVADYSVNDEKLQVKGYGRYQFYYKTNLIDFLRYLDEEYFKVFIEYGQGSDKLNDYSYGLQIAFTDYYNDFKDKMIQKQDEFIYSNYYLSVKDKLLAKSIDLNGFSEYLKGAVMSYTMFNLERNEIMQNINNQLINKLAECYSNDENIFISNIYNYLIEINSTNEITKERFIKEKRACLEHQDDLFNSKIGEMINTGGTSNSLSSIRQINEQNPQIFEPFLKQGKFYTKQQLDWYNSVRTSVDFKKEFGIDSGVLDFGISTSKGYNIDNYINLVSNEVAFKVPNNNCPVMYIPQNYMGDDKDYATIKFGANNIAQGGGSLACLSMCITYFNENNVMTLPNDIVDKIKENHNDDYNFYYNVEKKGQDNEIITDVCKYYGLNSGVISGNSIASVLASGGLVIARVKESEFTRWGNFVLIAGSQVIDGIQMFYIYDPNIYHANYLYKLYDLNYLLESGGTFFKISK